MFSSCHSLERSLASRKASPMFKINFADVLTWHHRFIFARMNSSLHSLARWVSLKQTIDPRNTLLYSALSTSNWKNTRSNRSRKKKLFHGAFRCNRSFSSIPPASTTTTSSEITISCRPVESSPPPSSSLIVPVEIDCTLTTVQTTTTDNSTLDASEARRLKKIKKLERQLTRLAQVIQELEEKDMSLEEMEHCDLYLVESNLKRQAFEVRSISSSKFDSYFRSIRSTKNCWNWEMNRLPSIEFYIARWLFLVSSKIDERDLSRMFSCP